MVFEQDGKYGLTYQSQYLPPLELSADTKLILVPAYSSIAIANQDVPLPESERKRLEKDKSVIGAGECNWPVIIADGKQGLVEKEDIVIPIKYDQIVKLTLWHYLCKENTTWILFRTNKYCTKPALIARFQWEDELTLEKLLQILDNMNAYRAQTKHDYDALSESLYKAPEDGEEIQYISEYRRYYGWQYFADVDYTHDFIVYTERVIIDNNFRITHYDNLYPNGRSG